MDERLTELAASRAQLAGSFGRTVDEYERGRPNYPDDAVHWLIGDARKVIDLGAGTGKLTRSLLGLVGDVVALEPEHSMAQRLTEVVTGVRAVCARAEALPVRGGWADVVVVAQAFHWFDQSRALPEIARVLKPHGRLGLVWNVRDQSIDWVAALSKITGGDNSEQTRFVMKQLLHFEQIESRTFRSAQPLDRDTLIAHVHSRSHVAALDEVDRQKMTDAVLRLCDTHRDLVGKSRFALPYVTQAFRANRS